MGQGKALLQYIKDLIYRDRKTGSFKTRQAQKLTIKHTFLPQFSKMSVEKAAQVLSYTASSGNDAAMVPKKITENSHNNFKILKRILMTCLKSSILGQKKVRNLKHVQ